MQEFRRIVCPVDFSDFSLHAFDHAMALARWYHARVSVLHVRQLVTPLAASPGFAGDAFDVIRLTDGERDQLREGVCEFVSAEIADGVAVDVVVEEDFNVADAVVAYATSIGADLIVLGTHGRTGFTRLLLGSVAERVLRTAGCAALVVPPHAADAVPHAPVAYQRVLCPVDFSAASAGSLRVAASLASRAGGRVTAAHIVDMPAELVGQPVPDLAEYRAMCFEQARRSMKEAIAKMPAPGAVDELLLAGKPAREILRLADEQQADLIVMGVQGRGAIDRWLFGSVTEQVVRRALCPVLTLHAAPQP